MNQGWGTKNEVVAVTDRQKKFAEAFAACGNAAQAAREAGYSERTARAQGARLLTNADVLQYVRALQDQAAERRIASMLQVKALWSDVLNDSNAKTADRLRAGELLAKAAGAFLHVRPGSDDDVGRLAVGECGGEDILIFLPEIGREEDFEVKGNDG